MIREISCDDYWMESLDYRYHRACVNRHNAHVEADGSVRVVLAHQNPGSRFPNWLETCGHREGGMLWRWVEAETHPPVDTHVVKFAELASL